jgi:hypothetical protein
MPLIQRYTELPFALQALANRELTLIAPSSWDDKNDAYYLHSYKRSIKARSVLALCMTTSEPTYHHWKVYTNGASGVCIRFHEERFQTWLQSLPAVVGRRVEYKSLKELREAPPSSNDLAFVKRSAFRHEEEFRLVYTSKTVVRSARGFEFPIAMIDSIVLNPWMPRSTFHAVRAVLRGLEGYSELLVHRATIIDNDQWRAAADSAA